MYRKTSKPVGQDDKIRKLKTFYRGQTSDPFSFARFSWPSGSGSKESIVPRFRKKRRPAAAESLTDTAARVEVLVRPDVGEDYTDPDFLVRSYEEALPLEETIAFLQVTMRFPTATNLHGPFEQARSWLRSFYVEPFGLPVVAVLHAPYLAGSESPVHVHGLVMPRRLSPFGWLTIHRGLGSDERAAEALASWNSHKLI